MTLQVIFERSGLLCCSPGGRSSKDFDIYFQITTQGLPNTCSVYWAFEAPVIMLKLFWLIKSINRKHFSVLGAHAFSGQEHRVFSFSCVSTPGSAPSGVLSVLFSDTVRLQECDFPLRAAGDHISVSFSLFYFPMQKSLKMMSRISSAPTRPVIRPRLVTAKRTPSAARARSVSRYRWYWARAAAHRCRWARWRACVRVGAPNRGSPHLQRKLISECEEPLEENYKDKDALGRLP